MSVSFVTSKLKTQSLAGEEDDEAKRSAQDPTPSADERDHDENDPPPHVIVEASQTSSTQLIMRGDGGNLSVGVGGGGGHFVPPHDEDYSSEEELKEIISCRKRQKKQQRARSKPYSSNAITPSRNSMSSRSSSAAGGKAVLGCSNSGNGSGAKRKLSTDGYYYLCDSSSDVSSTTPKARPASSSLRRCRSSLSAPSYKSFSSRPASGVTSRAQSVALSALHSSEAADADVQSRNLDTPVQFCTSPPVNVHRPKRQANKMAPPPSTAFMFGRSPPTKMFHFQPLEPVGRQQTEPHEDEDDPEVSAATAASSVLEAHDDVDSNGETPDAGAGGGVAGSEEPGQENVADGRGVGGGRPSAIAKPVRKSQSQTGLHHLLGASSSTPRRSTQVKVTRAGRRRQRPSLDFEKMQQIKKKVVTSWRPQGGELSLFCW